MPARRAGALRRTTSLDSHWPEGFGAPLRMIGQARDLVTGADGAGRAIAGAEIELRLSQRREILAIRAEPDRADLQALVGVRGGGASRSALAEALGHERGGSLFQLLDDFAGASLVAPWILWEWPDHGWEPEPGRLPPINVCHGFAEGNSAALAVLDGNRHDAGQRPVAVVELANPDDQHGFHALPDLPGPAVRRARWIDIWRNGDGLAIEAGFQDSGSTPDRGRVAIHEYRVSAHVDADGLLARLDATPLILPFRECPGAVAKIGGLIGRPVAQLRETVPELLATTMGCTHLNDVLRALSDAQVLAAALDFELT